MELKGKRVIILIENMYNEHEFWYPFYRLKEVGAEVVVVGTGGLQYTSKIGLPAKADESAKNISGADFDGIIIPGGYAPDFMRRDPDMIRLVKECFDQGKIVAAICHAGWMLVSAEIVANKRATSYFSIKDDMVNGGANWVDEEVVIDGNLITSRTPADLPAFMRAVVEALS